LFAPGTKRGGRKFWAPRPTHDKPASKPGTATIGEILAAKLQPAQVAEFKLPKSNRVQQGAAFFERDRGELRVAETPFSESVKVPDWGLFHLNPDVDIEKPLFLKEPLRQRLRKATERERSSFGGLAMNASLSAECANTGHAMA
jgi:hypothetical protein